jgi:hypothetical protein
MGCIHAIPRKDMTQVRRLINSKDWQKLSGTKVADIQTKLKLMEAHGIPKMMVLSGSRLVELGRIPHSEEGEAVPAEEALVNRGVLIFVSHRWLQPAKNKPGKFWCLTSNNPIH